MTGKGHRRFNIITAPAMWVGLLHFTSPMLAAIATVTYVAACRLPDHLEIRTSYTETVIPHRTITHWGLMWIGLMVIGFGWMQHASWAIGTPLTSDAEIIVGALLFGCAAGSVMHLVLDSPDYMGIPWFFPWMRIRLCLWRSGSYEWVILGVASLCTLIFLASDYNAPALHFFETLLPSQKA